MEKLDVYNVKKQKTGKVIDRDIKYGLEKGEYILYVKCCIINEKGEILLTRRNLDKLRGGTWEIPGGCVIRGETSIQGIIREIKEEIGLIVKENEIRLVRTAYENRKHRSFIRDIYVLEKEVDIKDLNFLDEEVIEAKFITIEEFVKMKREKRKDAWLNEIYEEYKKIIDKKRGN